MPHIQLAHPPQTRDQLWAAVAVLFGVRIPRTQVCPDHVAPFTAFADAYFRTCTLPGYEGQMSRAIWHASRGLAGKSKTLSILGLTFTYIDGADTTILGGSMTQSVNVHEYMVKAMESENLPPEMTLDQTATRIQLTNKGRVRPLPASQRTVRGPHPSVLLMDEVDEMDIDIYDAALGQPMPQEGYLKQTIETMTVLSSTWQYADGCVVLFTPVTTRRGVVPVQDVQVGDEVPTRDGWRRVTASINTGSQECVTVVTRAGRHLTCTPWHPFWVEGVGWVEASALTPGLVIAVHGNSVLRSPSTVGFPSTDSAAPSTARIGNTLDGQVVTLRADLLGNSVLEGPGVVDGLGDDFQVPDVHAGTTGAAAGLDVVDGQAVRDGAIQLDPDPTVSKEGALRRVEPAVTLGPVATGQQVKGPEDAVVGRHIDDYVFAQDEVASVSHTRTLLPTWDLTVEGTHEYVAAGILVHNTFTEILRRAEEKHQPVYRWCYKENQVENNPVMPNSGRSEGWLTAKTIQEKKDDVSEEMFRVEYDLGEPSIGNRAVDTEKLDQNFFDIPAIWEEHKKDWDEWRFFARVPGATYCAGADWAKEKDKTVISIVRTDQGSRELVYTARINRTNYPRMVGLFNRELMYYQCGLNGVWHDSTGLGNVIDDLTDVRARPFTMTGVKRTKLLSDYVLALEKVTWKIPKLLIKYYTEHKYASVGDLYSSGTSKEFHLPDTFCSLALAEYGAERVANGAAPINVEKDGTPTRDEKFFGHQDQVDEFASLVSPVTSAGGINLSI